MLDRFLNRLVTWSPLQFWAYTALAALLVMEVVSWITSQVPPCIVNPEDYAHYAGNDECPTQHVFLIVSMAGILETIGHNWVTALSTVVIASFTGTIYLINKRQLRHAREVERAYVFGGCGGQTPILNAAGNPIGMRVQATHGNYGENTRFR